MRSPVLIAFLLLNASVLATAIPLGVAGPDNVAVTGSGSDEDCYVYMGQTF
ncbi:hypothetical protein EXIGLDRAFT_778353 [Exidia glandulosa HHB12029]|uniref:Uncharacterized protein n=1 Tax=Exidia glandulosa HHB12029 TaxID=1314781 RepID=A0A165CK41_EXIGL|nr:hypothetical protein EXIGLDRAFT_778353 [Exidia glandulosa HHB12029]